MVYPTRDKMEFDSRTIAFLAVAAFLCMLFLFCIILSVLFYVKYKNSDCPESKEEREQLRIKKLKHQLAKQFKDELKQETCKRTKQGKVCPLEPPDDCCETACSICLDSLAYGDTSCTMLASLIKCGHVYHMDCVWPWLEKDHSCPICRREMHLSLASIKAVTMFHVLNNFDVQSIRESVSRADLRSRTGVDCMDVVSISSKSPGPTLIPIPAISGIIVQDYTPTPRTERAGSSSEEQLGPLTAATPRNAPMVIVVQ